MNNRLLQFQSIFFYLILLLLPTQLGRHFWPDFSYISGVRVDYLSPTIYITDLLLILLFITSVIVFFKTQKIKNQISKIKVKTQNSKFKIFIISFLLISIVAGIIFSKNQWAGLYGLLKITEFIFFGAYVSKRINSIKEIKNIVLIFSLAILFESFLAIFQYFNQGSLGGLFYWVGERMFNSQTPGIANASLNGQLILRPYGTFPHPNVLGGFLLIAMVLVISIFQFPIFIFKKTIFGISLLTGSIALLLTMSRAATIIWTILLIFYFLKHIRNLQVKIYNLQFQVKNVMLLMVFSCFISIYFFTPLGARFTSFTLSDEAVVNRKELMEKSIMMIKSSPVYGVGVNNFLVNLPEVKKSATYSMNNYLQPVHNIYLLIAAETGMVGLMVFGWLIVITCKRIKNNEQGARRSCFLIHNSKFIILSSVLILGIFDHYFLTIQQGQLLFSFVFGFCWAAVKTKSGTLFF